MRGLPLLGAGLAYVMQQRCPPEPQVITVPGNIIQNFKGMIEHILVPAAVDRLHSLQGGQFREYKFQQAASVQVYESLGRNRRQKYLVEFFRYALLGDDAYALAVFLK